MERQWRIEGGDEIAIEFIFAGMHMQPITRLPGFGTSSLIANRPWGRKELPGMGTQRSSHIPCPWDRGHQKKLATTKYFRRRCWEPPASQLNVNQNSAVCSSVYQQTLWVSKSPRRGQWAVYQSKAFRWAPNPQEHRLHALPQPPGVSEATHPSIPGCFTLIIWEQKAKFSLLFF